MTQDKKLLIGTIVVAGLIFVALAWALISSPSGTQTFSPSFDDSDDPAQGPADAKVVVRLFSDLQCQFCKSAELSIKYMLGKYGDRVRFIWKDFPLLTTHPNARRAANAGRCAEAQGKFWEYKDVLFREQDSWKDSRNLSDLFKNYAAELFLNAQDFASCLDSSKFDGLVMADVSEGNRNRVDRTPTYFINNERQFGLNEADWDRILTAALSSE